MAITPVPDPFAVPDAPLRGVHTNTEYRTRADALMASLAGMVAWLRLVALSALNNALSAFADATQTALDRNQTGLDRAATAASMASALGAPGTRMNSTTPVVLGAGEKTFIVETGKLVGPGQAVVSAVRTNPGVQIAGLIKTYNTATGELVLQDCVARGATGTYADWVVALTAQPAFTDGKGLPEAVISTAGPHQLELDDVVVVDLATASVTLIAPADMPQAGKFEVRTRNQTGGNRLTINNNGQVIGTRAEPFTCSRNVATVFVKEAAAIELYPYAKS